MKTRLSDSILYEDQHYLAINKWPGISTLADRHQESCLLDEVRGYYEGAQVCHRLDKFTSGVLVFAKHQEAYRNLSLQFQARSVKKVYHAIVEGRHYFNDRNIELPLYQGRRGHVRVSHMSGKDAVTLVNTLKEYYTHSLLRCEPVTGRTHQIRAHLSAVGAPLLGDLEYGGHELYLSEIKRHYNLRKDSLEHPLMSRPALHALSLGFQTLSDQFLEIEAGYPKDFRATLNQLNKIDALGEH